MNLNLNPACRLPSSNAGIRRNYSRSVYRWSRTSRPVTHHSDDRGEELRASHLTCFVSQLAISVSVSRAHCLVFVRNHGSAESACAGMWRDSLRRIPPIGFCLVGIRVVPAWLVVAAGGVLSEGCGHDGPGVCSSRGQTEPEGAPSQVDAASPCSGVCLHT